MTELRLVSEREPKPDDLEAVRQGIYRFNMGAMNDWNFRDIAIFLRDEADVVQGGLLGVVWGGWFHLEFLWIDEAYRHLGYGDRLMQTAEAEARAHGADSAYLETHSFQARPFYERHGYQVVGELKNYPPGQTYYFLSKAFSDEERPMKQTTLYPMLLEPALHVKVWGGRRLETRMRKHLPTAEPYGESWEMHDSARVANGALRGRTLDDVLREFGADLIGARNNPAEGLPLLVKFLDATEWLSVQVHPNDAQAKQLEGEPRGKTEAWYVIAAEPDARLVIGVKPNTTREQVAEAIRDNRLEDILVYANVVAGDVLFIPAGTIHALGPGVLVYEIQQSSDTTYRLYDWGRMGLDGKPRPLHVEKSAAVSELGKLPPIKHTGGDISATVEIVDSPFFKTELHQLSGGSVELDTAGRVFHVLTCIEGEAAVHTAGSPSVVVQDGQTVLIPAVIGRYSVTGTGKLLRSYQPG